MTGGGAERIDPAAIEALHEQHAGELHAFLVGVLRNPELAAEALQATFAKAVEVGHTARNETLKGWLFRVAFHEALALKRRHQVEIKSLRQLAWNRTGTHEPPESNLARTEEIERIRQAIDTLPEEQRQIVHLRIHEEKTFASIAAELGLPLGTVLTRMRLALKKLEKQLTTDH